MGKSSKHKKKKSKKSSKKKSDSSSSSSSDEWQEASTNVVDSVSSTTATTNVDGKSENTNEGRAAWMDSTSVLGSLTAKPTKKVQKEEQDIDKPPPVHSRELNSYWKANGLFFLKKKKCRFFFCFVFFFCCCKLFYCFHSILFKN